MTASAKSKPDEQAPAERTQGLSPEHVKARRLCEKRWSPPKALAFSVLKQPRPPLMDVLSFLAFGKPAPPKKISPLMRRSHWERSFKALCAAARDDKAKLVGRRSAEGPSQPIPPPEFDSPLWFDDEQGTIGTNLAAFAVEQFARAREENRLWHDVRVELETLERWVADEQAATNVVSREVSVGRPSDLQKVEDLLAQWIKNKAVENEVRRSTPAEKGNAIGLTRLDRALGKRCDVNPLTIGRARLKPKNKPLADLYAVALSALQRKK
jgi:hypothetical protein